MDAALAIKIVAVVVVLLSALIGGWIPVRFGASDAGRRNLVLGNAFAGGVFLAAGLVHLLPDSIGLLAERELGGDYPLAPLIAAGGFLLVLSIEQVADEEARPAAAHRTSAAILFLVLAVHSLIAGTALGLEQDAAATLALLIAIVGHKASAAFALGVTLEGAGVRGRAYVRRLALFSVATPLGIAVGSIASELLEGSAAQITEGVFDGVAAGTFLYIATMEIGAEVFGDPGRRLAKVLLAAGGLGVMALVAIWT